MALFWVISLLGAALAGLAFIAPLGRRRGVMPVAAAIAGVVALAVLIYLPGGRPGMEGAPFAAAQAERASQNPEEMTDEERFKRLEDMVAETPEDPAALRFYARELLRRERALEAVETYRELAGIEPTAANFTEMGEAIIVLNEGQLTPEARAAFRRALTLDPQSLSAAFYLAAADYDETPNAETALALAETPARAAADDPRGAQLAAAAAARLTQPRMGPQTGDGAPPPSVEAMVGRLKTRAEANPDDIGLWLSLARVQSVTGNRDAALGALNEARMRFGDRSGAAQTIEAVRTQIERAPAENAR
ncbi:tetratricopeptide repeat protein [Euryhalocaulis caribicus]|uniref:tetratricopeptide repeat protein n=1 Tax=Euryhalocaulis caribicus TaxID=1161401 RepID=UPI0003A320DE|nr:hypothetical protein [Euryhalocaulis caribicus]